MAGIARSLTTDPFNSARFIVTDTKGYLQSTPVAGFTNVTMPEVTQSHVEYKEGTWTFKAKFPGDITFAPITMSKGVAKNDTTFFKWIRNAILSSPYRTDIVIHHFHREDTDGVTDFKSKSASRKITLKNAIPTRVKLGSDLDANSHDISIEELEVEFEWFNVQDGKNPPDTF